MKALTLYQPWATLVAIGAKRIETRSWKTNYRGPLAIHVSKNKKIDHNLWWSEPFASALEGTLVHIGPSQLLGQTSTSYQILTQNLCLGCVIATCELVACQKIDDYDWSVYQSGWMKGTHFFEASQKEKAFGNFEIGRYMWFLANIQKLPEPIPAKGAMGLWEFARIGVTV